MIIRDALPGDGLAIEALAHEIWAGHDVMDQAGRHGHQALVATVSEQIVGVASARRGRRDPGTVALHVDVAKRSRRLGVGSALMADLLDVYPARLHVARALRSRPGAQEFLSAMGFRRAEVALEGWIEPRRMTSWVADVARRPGRVIRAAAPDELGDVARLLGRSFRATHPWNPPAPFTVEEAHELFVEDAVAGCIFVAVADGDIWGAAVLSEAPFGPRTASLQWATAVEEVDVARLVAACLRAAADRGFTVRAEVNDHNGELWRCLESMPGLGLEQDLVVMIR